MGKTNRRNPAYFGEDDRWMRKGGTHRPKSRKKDKQDFLKQIEDFEDYGR